MFAIPWLKAGIFLISIVSVLYLVYFALYLPYALRPARKWAKQAPRWRTDYGVHRAGAHQGRRTASDH